jgi:multiple sugar transport system substrate-binding protein
MKSIKVMVCFGLILLLCVGSVFAGGRSQDKNSGAAGSKELTVVYSGTPQPAEKEYVIDVYAKKFETQYGVKVNVEFISQADTIRKIESEQDTKNFVSDIVYADTANMAPYVNDGWMEDISRMIRPGTTITKMYDDTTNKGTVRYFVPNSFDV